MADAGQHHNHRARMYQRAEQAGFENFAEHEMLEYLLYFAIPRKDTNGLAHTLMEHFGGFAQVLEASEDALQQIPGIGPGTARLLHSILPLYNYYARCKQCNVRYLKDDQTIQEYFRALFAGVCHEVLYMAALDDRHRLLRVIKLGEGLSNTVEASRALVVAKAVEARATGVILAHNHPGGVAMVSEADVVATIAIMNSLVSVNIPVLDHIIVAGNGDVVSMRRQNKMPYYNPATGEVRYFHER